MTAYEWSMLSVAIVGVLCTVGTILVSVARAVSKVEINSEARIVLLRVELDKRFITQDEVYREVAQGLRKFIELVEAEMHRIEIWGRDHYVLKEDHSAALSDVRSDIRNLAVDIKTDFTQMRNEFRDELRNLKSTD